jgi:hypothetical protein
MITDYFNIAEVTCPEVYHKYSEFAWNFFDMRLIVTMEAIRMRLNKAITVNDWQSHGQFSQRGLRCPQCDLIQNIYAKDELFMDPHALGKAWDFDVQGMVAEEVRQYLIQNKNLWPYSFRLENQVSWVHLDTYNQSLTDKVILFNT